MAMDADDIERLIKEALPDAVVEIRDLAGDGDHYAATVDLRRLQRQDAGAAAPDRLCRAEGRDGRRAARPCAADRHAGALGSRSLRARALTRVMKGQTMAHRAVHRQRSEVQRRRAVHEGHAAVPACAASPARSCRSSTISACPIRASTCSRSDDLRQGIKDYSNWPTIPAALREGRVRRRLRHHPRDVPGRRAAAALQGQGHPGADAGVSLTVGRTSLGATFAGLTRLRELPSVARAEQRSARHADLGRA